MIVDFDDFHEQSNRLDLLRQLRTANPLFRCTVFAIPAFGSDQFWNHVPDWIELAVHGYQHGDPPTDGGECKNWGADEMRGVIALKPDRFVEGFKAPGWQISDGCYEALNEAGWWVADQPYNDTRRPSGLRTHRLGDGDHWHGHIQNVCGNGLEETLPVLLERVTAATSFELVSEMVFPWQR